MYTSRICNTLMEGRDFQMSSNMESVIPLTPVIRKKATRSIWTTKDELFDMKFLHESLNRIVSEHESNQSSSTPLFVRLRTIDLVQFFKNAKTINRFFPCTFFEKRFGWVSKSESGEYRYFSKIKEGYGFYSFDLFDILTIVLNMTSKELIRYLESHFPSYSISEWSQLESTKYEENLKMLHHKELSKTPYLQRLLRGGIEVLESFLSFGKSKINGKHLSDGEHSVFFLSVQFFKENYFPKKSVSTLNQWMNLFAVLGLIEKTANVPIELQIEAEKQQTLKKKQNHISFYLVPSFEKVFGIAETRAKELVSQRISYHQLTKELVLTLFGKALHDHVYIQKTHGRRKKEKKTKVSIDWIETFFAIELGEKGMVAKKDFLDSSPLSKKTLNETWNNLLRFHKCELSVPTKEEREKYGWASRQVVARKSETDIQSGVWRHEDVLPWDIFDTVPNEYAVVS